MGRDHKQLVYLGIFSLFLAGCGGGGGSDGGGGGGNPPPPTNTAPTISGAPDESVSAGKTWSFTPTASDADGDTLTFSVANGPTWASFDTATGELTGTPFSADIGTAEDIRISVSDGRATTDLPAFDIMVTPQVLNMSNFAPGGDVFPTDDGYRSVGSLTLDTGEHTQQFDNSDLTLSFDEEGNLLDLFGETDLPPAISEHVEVNAGIRSFVGMMTGAEISADPFFGIQLPAEINYFVYYLDVGIELVVTNPVDPSIVNVENLAVPLNGQIILISDPTDAMLYRYGEVLGKGVGRGESISQLYRWDPVQDFGALESFNGTMIDRGQIDFGIKGAIDVVSLEGYRVVKQQSFLNIDFTDPLNSEFDHRTGANGVAHFGLSIGNVGVFDFADVSLSAVMIQEIIQRESIWSFSLEAGATQGDVWVPDWFHVLPRGEFHGDANFTNTGQFLFDISGRFESIVPAATIAGEMFLSNDGARFAGLTAGEGEPLEVSIEFAASQTIGRVKYPSAYEETLRSDVADALDRELARIDDALADLEEATADYEFEVSLRGLRESLPTMMDTATSIAQAIPGTIESRARSAALTKMRTTCTTVVFVTTCVDDVVDEVSIANSVASSARSQAASNIVPYVSAMQNLKARALEDDDEALREALRAALAEAYNRRTYSHRIRITRRINAGPFDTTLTMYDETYTRQVLNTSDANAVAEARDNAHRIQETSDRRIAAQDVVDALPIRENVEQTKDDVNNGTRTLPIPQGLGYTASGGNYTAFITIDGEDHATEVNVLSPEEVLTGAADAVADLLLE